MFPDFSYVYSSGFVRRYHTEQMVKDQNTAAHAWGVASILLHLWPDDCTADMIYAALMHDVPEKTTGDIPATAKWGSTELKNALDRFEDDIFIKMLPQFPILTDRQRLQIKLSDMLELVLYCRYEMSLGNKNAEIIYQRGKKFLVEKNIDLLNEEQRKSFLTFLGGL